MPWPAVQHGCYRDSRLQSIPMAAAFAVHRTDQRAVDRYIALSPSIAESLRESGLVDAEKIVIRPNSVPDPGAPAPPGSGLLFVGRLSREKGLPLLLDAWERSGAPFGTLTIVGDGPERSRVEAAARTPGSRVEFLGPLNRAAVDDVVRTSAAVVVPSTAPEALSLVVLEALAHGRPVLAARTGGLPSVVNDSVGWLSAPDAAELAETLSRASRADLHALGRGARAAYERSYSPTVVIEQQIQIYRAVLEDRDLRAG
jgi:glycosyltransferase involved in cell wall biosynthesis